MSDSSISTDSQGNSITNFETDKESSQTPEYDVNYSMKPESYDQPIYQTSYEQYTDIVNYTPHTLTVLEPYRPSLISISPPLYTKMNPTSYIENIGTLDDVAVVPSSILSAEERAPQDGSSSPVEDYKNLATITPTLFEIKKEPIFFSEDMESVASSSSPASSHSSWLQSTQLDDHRHHISDSPTGTGTDMIKDYSDVPGMWQCVNCATVSSDTGTWWPDDTGHFLCGRCNKIRNFVSITDKSIRNKNFKNLELDTLNRINHLPTRLHQRVNGIKKMNQVCSNCHTSSTSLWRRSSFGETVCNACGLYYKLHKRNRPITMRKDAIQKRKRKPKTQNKKFLTHTLLPLKLEDDDMNLSVSPNPPSYTSHLALVNGTPNDQESRDTIPMPAGQSLPSVHSPDGFSTQLSRYTTASVISRSPPLLESYSSNYLSPYSSVFSGYGSVSSSVSPTIASLLQSSHPYLSFSDSHSSANQTSSLPILCNL